MKENIDTLILDLSQIGKEKHSRTIMKIFVDIDFIYIDLKA